MFETLPLLYLSGSARIYQHVSICLYIPYDFLYLIFQFSQDKERRLGV